VTSGAGGVVRVAAGWLRVLPVLPVLPLLADERVVLLVPPFDVAAPEDERVVELPAALEPLLGARLPLPLDEGAYCRDGCAAGA